MVVKQLGDQIFFRSIFHVHLDILQLIPMTLFLNTLLILNLNTTLQTQNATSELWTIRTLANSALVNSDPKKFGPSQFGPRPLVNSDPFLLVKSDLKKKNSLVNSNVFFWSIRTFSIGKFNEDEVTQVDHTVEDVNSSQPGNVLPDDHALPPASVKRSVLTFLIY